MFHLLQKRDGWHALHALRRLRACHRACNPCHPVSASKVRHMELLRFLDLAQLSKRQGRCSVDARPAGGKAWRWRLWSYPIFVVTLDEWQDVFPRARPVFATLREVAHADCLANQLPGLVSLGPMNVDHRRRSRLITGAVYLGDDVETRDEELRP